MAERVLVIAPHPDDEAIGCGGVICLHRRRGDSVHIVFLTSGEHYTEEVPAESNRSVREAEAGEAARVLDVQGLEFLRLPDLGLSESIEPSASRLRPFLETFEPDILYLPHPQESHPDHAVVLPIIRAAVAGRACQRRLPELRGYEVWNPLANYHWVEDISSVMPQKMCAVRCYRSQLRLFRYDAAIRGLNRYRGILGAASGYAEAFVSLDARPFSTAPS